MKTIDEIQTEFVTAFNEIDDWMMQYSCLAGTDRRNGTIIRQRKK